MCIKDKHNVLELLNIFELFRTFNNIFYLLMIINTELNKVCNFMYITF